MGEGKAAEEAGKPKSGGIGGGGIYSSTQGSDASGGNNGGSGGNAQAGENLYKPREDGTRAGRGSDARYVHEKCVKEQDGDPVSYFEDDVFSGDEATDQFSGRSGINGGAGSSSRPVSGGRGARDAASAGSRCKRGTIREDGAGRHDSTFIEYSSTAMLPLTAKDRQEYRDKLRTSPLTGQLAMALQEDLYYNDFMSLVHSQSSGKAAYLEACSQTRISPLSCVLESACRSYMKLSHVGLLATGGSALPALFRVNTYVTHLNLSYNKLGDHAGAQILQALLDNGKSGITYLDMSSNSLAIESAEALERLLSAPKCNLKELILANNKLGDRIIGLLSTALITNSLLDVLDLSSNGISNLVGSLLTNLLQNVYALKTLRLGMNPIGSSGLLASVPHIAGSNCLTRLDLSFLGVDDGVAMALATVIEKPHKLKSLDLQRNKISKHGAIAFAGALRIDTTLEELDLNFNPLGLEGVLSLCEILTVNLTLKRLGLRDTVNDLVPILPVRNTYGLNKNVRGRLEAIAKGEVDPNFIMREVASPLPSLLAGGGAVTAGAGNNGGAGGGGGGGGGVGKNGGKDANGMKGTGAGSDGSGNKDGKSEGDGKKKAKGSKGKKGKKNKKKKKAAAPIRVWSKKDLEAPYVRSAVGQYRYPASWQDKADGHSLSALREVPVEAKIEVWNILQAALQRRDDISLPKIQVDFEKPREGAIKAWSNLSSVFFSRSLGG